MGWVTLLLAGLGAGIILGSRDAGARHRLAVVAGIPLLVALLLFSSASPVTVFGHAIKMPAAFLFDVLPYLRVFARFSAAVMVILLVFAALGLTVLLRGRAPTTRVAAISAVVILSALELPVGSPVAKPIHSDVPLRVNGRGAAEVPTWAWLKARKTDEIVYEYPGGPNEAIERFYMYGQMIHGHRITNGSMSPGQIGDDFMRANGNINWPGVPERLAGVGIALVTVNPWAYARVGEAAPPPDNPPEGFRLVERFPDGSAVWRVDAAPAAAVAVPRQAGWWDPEMIDARVWRWMIRRARVTVVAPTAGRYRIRFSARALDAAKGARFAVWLSGPFGSTPKSVLGRERDLSFDVTLPAGRSDIWTETSGPRPRRVGPGDNRFATIQVSDWEITREGRPAQVQAP